MRHRVYGKRLSRDKDDRGALFKNLVQSLILHESIHTTEAKAKAIKGLVDKLISKSKKSDYKLQSPLLTKKEISDKLNSDIAKRFEGRVSGFTTLVKLGRRKGDNAMVVKMSFVETAKVSEKKSRPTRKSEKETK